MKQESATCKVEGRTRVQWAVTLLVTNTVLTYGLQCGWTSPMAKVLQSAESPMGRPLTDTELSIIAGLPNLGAAVGILCLVYIVDTFGRKKGMILMGTLQLISWIITICPMTITSLTLARFFSGLGGGGCFHTVPMYIKEISQDNIRGTLGSMVVLNQTVGIFIMYLLGGYLDYYTVVYVVIGLPAITTAIMFTIPESPAFLVKTGKLEEAAATVAYLRGLHAEHKQVLADIASIKKEDDYFKSIPNISFFNIFKDKGWRRGFLIVLFLMVCRGFNGGFAIISYASIMLADSQVGLSAELQTLAIPVFLTIGSLTTMAFVDNLGRKVLLVITTLSSAVALIALASSMLLASHGWAAPDWLLLAALIVVVCGYGGGVSSIPFIVMSEMFNFQVRAKLMACLSIIAWLTSGLQVIGFTAVTGQWGAYTSFYIFGAINLLCTIVVLIVLPETRGKSVELIEAELRKEKKNVTS